MTDDTVRFYTVECAPLSIREPRKATVAYTVDKTEDGTRVFRIAAAFQRPEEPNFDKAMGQKIAAGRLRAKRNGIVVVSSRPDPSQPSVRQYLDLRDNQIDGEYAVLSDQRTSEMMATAAARLFDRARRQK